MRPSSEEPLLPVGCTGPEKADTLCTPTMLSKAIDQSDWETKLPPSDEADERE